MEILTLLRANIKRKKGTFFGILFLMLLVAALLTMLFSIKKNVAKSIDEAYIEAKAGDVVYYPGHYAMYMGDGKIVHAYNSRVGIVVSSVHAPGRILTIRRFVDQPVE